MSTYEPTDESKVDARTLPARHGLLWLLGGFALFRRNPPLLTTLTFAYLLLVVLVNVLPLIGPFLLPMLLPTLTAMLGNGCLAIERRGALNGQDLIQGLQKRHISLIRLGGLHLLGSTVLVIVGVLMGTNLTIDPEMSQERAVDLLKSLSVLMLLSSPLLMAFWFAPLLTLWNGVPAAKAVFFSFVASWRNWRAFATYGLAVMVVGLLVPATILLLSGVISGALAQVVAVVLRMLLIFIMAPVLIASVYLSYRDVFRTRSAPVATSIDVIA